MTIKDKLINSSRYFDVKNIFSKRPLVLRIISGLFLGIAVIALAFTVSKLFLYLLLAIVGALIAFEYHRLILPASTKSQHIYYGTGVGAICFILNLFFEIPFIGFFFSIFLLVVCCLWLTLFFFLWKGFRINDPITLKFLGLLIILGFSLGLGRAFQEGAIAILIPIGFTAMVDIGGFVTGKLWGKHSLAKTLSPKKTWEGFAGSFSFSALFLLLMKTINVFPISDIETILFIALLGSAISTSGDLYESSLKRHTGVKDSGSIIPGHGGIFDRVDGLIAVVPFYTLIYIYYNF